MFIIYYKPLWRVFGSGRAKIQGKRCRNAYNATNVASRGVCADTHILFSLILHTYCVLVWHSLISQQQQQSNWTNSCWNAQKQTCKLNIHSHCTKDNVECAQISMIFRQHVTWVKYTEISNLLQKTCKGTQTPSYKGYILKRTLPQYLQL